LASPGTKGKGLRKSVGFYLFLILFYPGQGQEGKEMIPRSRTRGYKTDLKRIFKIQENSRDDKEKDLQVKDKRIKNDKKRIKKG